MTLIDIPRPAQILNLFAEDDLELGRGSE